jgi:DNA-binding transcriptional regulator GbsR (MarR family)
MFTIVLEERKRREIDPTLAVLRECAIEIDRNTPDDKEARKRIREMSSSSKKLPLCMKNFVPSPAERCASF